MEDRTSQRESQAGTPEALARNAARRIVRDGLVRNGTDPEDCGQYAEPIRILYDAEAEGGTPHARRVWSDIIAPAYPDLAELVAGEEAKAPRYRVFSLADAMRPQPPIAWMIDGVASEGSLSLLMGDPGCKKTWLAIDAGAAVCEGQPWLGRDTQQAPVLIVDEESGRRRLERRIAGIVRARHVAQGAPFYYVSLTQFDFRQSEDAAALRQLIEETGARFVVIDALVDVMPGGDENAVKDVQPVLLNLRKIAEETGAALVLIHHTNKMGGYRGSSAISGAVDLMLKVESKKESPNIDISTEKVRDVEPFTMAAHIRFEDDPFRVYVSAAEPSSRAPSFNAGEKYVLRYLRQNGASTTSDIKDSADTCAPSTARQSIYKLVERGLVERVDDGGAGSEATFRLTQKAHQMEETR